MQQFLDFWKKDFINKLIIIHTSLLFIGVTALVVFLFRMPEGKTFGGLLGNLFPTPTSEPKVLMTQAAEQAILKMYYATASVPPTITTAPIAELFYTDTPTPSGIIVLPTDTAFPTETAFVLPTATNSLAELQATAAIATTTGAGSDSQPASIDCIPSGASEKGRVLDVLAGDTIKVLIGEYTFVVKYIGVESPAIPSFALMSKNINGNLTFGRDVTLYKDKAATDDLGMLLRYVVVNGKMPALDLLEQGLLTSYDPAPNSACYALLKQAEQKARDQKQGIWSVK
jgi:endonuclease YncB( thermonuclease family)